MSSPTPTPPEELARRALWDLAAESAGIGTYVWHLPSRELVADDRILRLSGIEPDEYTGRAEDFYARVHPEDRPAVVAAAEAAAATGAPYRAEYRVEHADGSTRWVASHGRAVTGADGTTTGLVGAAYDITALRAATERTSEVLETMAVGYLAIDRGWRMTYVNAEGERITGHPREDLVGRDFWQTFPATAGTVFEESYRRTATTGEVTAFDAYHPAPLDAWVEVRAVPRPAGIALYFLDVTARRRAQDAAELSSTRVAALGEVAFALTATESVTDLIAVIAERGLAALGADGGAVAVPDSSDSGVLLSYVTASYRPGSQADYGHLPVEADLPVCEAYRTGTRVLLPDRAASLAHSADMRAVNDATGSLAWASVPLRAGGTVVGVLTAGWRTAQTFDAEQLDLLESFAAQCALALQRLGARDAERAATRAARRSAAQNAALVAVARALGDAADETSVLAVVATRGLSVLDASGAGLCLRDPDRGGVRILSTDTFSDEVRAQVQQLPADFPMPVVHSAVTGTAHHLEDRARTTARFPGSEPLYTAAGMEASASVPLHAGGQLLGSLSLGFEHPRAWPQDDRDLLEAFATLTAQALERITSRAAERAASAEVARFSETLQRSLLTAPPEPDHLQIAVRYAPAAAQAQVGGDWYDAFITPGGQTSIVIGDVTGHDSQAAAAMAQVRNLLRGIGHAVGDPPAAVLSALDAAVHDLAVGSLATAVLAQVEQTPEHRAAGTRLLRWSSAGHLPPLLITPGGASRYLDTDPDLLLGLDPHAVRHDHEVVLEPGATVLLYTDGLVERRGAPLPQGLAWLAAATAELSHLGLEELLDALLALVGERGEDDVALLALRAHPEDGPRPAEAGPGRDPLQGPTVASTEQQG